MMLRRPLASSETSWFNEPICAEEKSEQIRFTAFSNPRGRRRRRQVEKSAALDCRQVLFKGVLSQLSREPRRLMNGRFAPFLRQPIWSCLRIFIIFLNYLHTYLQSSIGDTTQLCPQRKTTYEQTTPGKPLLTFWWS